ncbi:hypothetical protein [Phaeobacter sp. 22II1-1F12B]|uniref:hypothetical protein n=1 Tax=Phaeobacter sp. 22II1-1F12B TaxID=1317111 RepID=UPI000B51E8AB|nr:hypothetical protein [Phaeobacter sp. 22II1-1F12B]OWU76370.1 hypothetical protein ATO1_17175 [Phaeobacter sp. 22II1-1F12B]
MADFSNAKSEHQIAYLLRHAELNNHVKVATAAVDHLGSFSKDPMILGDKISQLILDAGERWTRTTFADPKAELDAVRRQISEMAIVRVYSSFNVFSDEIDGSYNDYKRNAETEGGNTIERIYSKFDWNIESISYLLPVLNFYEVARHCVAHQMGMPNKQVSTLLSDVAFLSAIENWPTVIEGRKLSPPPSISDGCLMLSPHHPITYSDVCLRIVRDIDSKLFETLGLKYYAKRIGRRDILQQKPGFEPVQRDAYAYIRHKLSTEHGISGLTISEIRQSLGGDEEAKRYYHKYNEKRLCCGP